MSQQWRALQFEIKQHNEELRIMCEYIQSVNEIRTYQNQRWAKEQS